MESLYSPLARQVHEYPAPLVIALNGPAIGVGVGLALNADFVVAGENCYFSLPFVPKLGIIPDMGSGWLLTQSLGYKRAVGLSLPAISSRFRRRSLRA
jgi:2-(1,2-epoxy-1,2-dihydrophenyl)acetyl-CoA isomerase